MQFKKLLSIIFTVAAIIITTSSAYATNGMNFSGYGPEAAGQGGASYAYDNGAAAVINNPATLSFMAADTTRLDLALGFLGPDVSSSFMGMKADSSATAYFMPAFGWIKTDGDYTYGLAMFAQGGMGTEYSKSSFLALNSGEEVMSEISIGRLLAPLSLKVTDNFFIGGTFDFVWGGLDFKMAMPAADAAGLVTGGTMQLPMLSNQQYFRVNFANKSPFTGKARGYGWATKIGFVYIINDNISIGGVYHSETRLSDFEADDASISFGNMSDGAVLGDMAGRLEVNDFQWPSTFGLGTSIKVTDDFIINADIKRIRWNNTMKAFNLTYVADGNMGYVNMSLPQHWEHQTVYLIGCEYTLNEEMKVRFGYNYSENPVPDMYVNPLFPAIVEKHITFGFDYQASKDANFQLGLVYAPDVEVTTPGGIEISHGQITAQIMYTIRK